MPCVEITLTQSIELNDLDLWHVDSIQVDPIHVNCERQGHGSKFTVTEEKQQL